jgi:hypothetical protein
VESLDGHNAYPTLRHLPNTNIFYPHQDLEPGDSAHTSHTAYLVIHGLLHERRTRLTRRDRAKQDRRRSLPWNCRRPVENRVQLRQLGLATGGWPTVKGGRKVGSEDRRGLIVSCSRWMIA